MGDGDKFLNSLGAAIPVIGKNASAVEETTVPATPERSSCSTPELNAISLSQNVVSSESLPEVASQHLQSLSFKQPKDEEETGDSSHPATPENPGLVLNRFRISETAITLITSRPDAVEGISGVGGISVAESIVEELHIISESTSPQNHDVPALLELPSETSLDNVTTECVFPCGEPSFDYECESTSLGEGKPDSTCSICLDNHMNCALAPCGHFACLPCVKQWRWALNPADLTCHVCRQVVEEVVKF